MNNGVMRSPYYETRKAYREANREFVKRLCAEWVEAHPVHTNWRSMKARCYNPKCVKYKDYGARGIKVCDRWLGEDGYTNFEADMGPKPTPAHTLEREDNNGNYEPDNCVWATRKTQQRNRRVNRLVTINGVTKCLAQWAEENGLKHKTLEKRVNNGWPDSRLLEPADQRYHTFGSTRYRG